MGKNNQAAELASIIGTYRVHPFPARMAPAIALRRLRQDKKLRVLDPMAGSGTTLVVARMLGHEAIGFDTDPLAVTLARAWSHKIDENAFRTLAEKVLCQARARYSGLPRAEAYPVGTNEETKAFIRYWFDDTNRRQLASLARAISVVTDQDDRALLWCAFSRMIITKGGGVSRAIDVSHSRPHRVCDIAPVKAFDHFPRMVEAVIRAAPFKNSKRALQPIKVKRGDARAIPLKDRTVDVVITSPPYLNAIDYMRGHKLSLVWQGHDVESLRSIRSDNIGTEVSNDSRRDAPYLASLLRRMTGSKKLQRTDQGMLARYVKDMDGVMREITRVLVHGGKATFVVGDSTLKGVFVRNSTAIRSLGVHHGLTLRSQTRRELPNDRRYLPPPAARGAGKELRARMREEVILTFSKN